jgi:hypothetical protein
MQDLAAMHGNGTTPTTTIATTRAAGYGTAERYRVARPSLGKEG